MGTLREIGRLTVLVTCIALATTRLGLLAHELLGHGGTALAMGGTVDQVRLFWFAGGWIHYRLPEPSWTASVAIAMGGIAVELVCGFALWLAVRGPTFPRALVRAVGTALVVHASWYLATGAWHGYGDGAVLREALGDGRYALAIAAGAVVCIAGFLGARAILGPLASTLPRARIAGTVAALAIAAGIHGGLAAGELLYRRDATYRSVMSTESERMVARDYARWEAQHQNAAPEAREQQHAEIEKSHRTFPFAWVLGAATALAVGLGALRTRTTDARISRRMLAVAIAAAAGAIAIVVVTSLWTAA